MDFSNCSSGPRCGAKKSQKWCDVILPWFYRDFTGVNNGKIGEHRRTSEKTGWFRTQVWRCRETCFTGVRSLGLRILWLFFLKKIKYSRSGSRNHLWNLQILQVCWLHHASDLSTLEIIRGREKRRPFVMPSALNLEFTGCLRLYLNFGSWPCLEFKVHEHFALCDAASYHN